MFLGGILFASASGCAAPPSPAPTHSPDEAWSAGKQAVATLRAALDAVASQDAPHAALLAWALSVSDDQFAALSLPAIPATARRIVPTTPTGAPSITPMPTSSPTPPDTPAASPVNALVTAAAAFAAESTAEAASRPLLWASMSGWALALAAQWPAANAALEPARTVLDPAPQTPAAAVQSALDAANASLYGLQVAAGAPGLAPKEKTELLNQQESWLTLRDALSEATATASPEPTPAPPWYEVARPQDPAAVHALAAKLHHDALPVIGRALAYAPAALRGALTNQIATSASVLPMWGGLMQRWPGLPLR